MMQETYGYSFFHTPIGRCAIVFGSRGVVGVCLPERSLSEAKVRLVTRWPSARPAEPTTQVNDAIDRIVALLSGQAAKLSPIALDMRGLPPFHVKVYEAARTIEPGGTLSYGEVAELVGCPGAARAVGQALGRNPFAVVVPCHRVLGANGKLVGFTATGGIDTKQRMLLIEQGSASPTTKTRRRPSPRHIGDDLSPALRHLRKSDPAMRRIISELGRVSLERAPGRSVFLALAEAIVYQQLTGKAAATIFGRVKALYPKGGGGLTPKRVLATPETLLRAAGLSGAKALALKDLAEKVDSGDIPSLAKLERMDDDAVIDRLTTVRGIGTWSAQMFLIFRLGRPDVLPLDDLGVRKGFGLMLGENEIPSKQQLESHGQMWAPYRTVASLYAWRAVDRARASTKPLSVRAHEASKPLHNAKNPSSFQQ